MCPAVGGHQRINPQASLKGFSLYSVVSGFSFFFKFYLIFILLYTFLLSFCPAGSSSMYHAHQCGGFMGFLRVETSESLLQRLFLVPFLGLSPFRLFILSYPDMLVVFITVENSII